MHSSPRARSARGRPHHALASPNEWQNSVVSNLSHADGTHQRAVDTLTCNMDTMRRTNAEYNRVRDQTHDQFFQKIENTKELVQQLKTRILSVSKTIEHSDWSHSKLSTASTSLREPIELNRSRLVTREKRPKRELVNDSFQEALVNEHQELQTAKYSLNESILDTQRIISELKGVREDLLADCAHKEHSLELDRQCAERKKAYEVGHTKLDKAYNRHGVPLKAILPEILGHPGLFTDGSSTSRGEAIVRGATEGRNQERMRQHSTLKLIETALRLEHAAKDRWSMTNQLLAKWRQAADFAHKNTQMEMGAKIERTELMRQELIKQRKTIEQKMDHGKKVMTALTEKINFIEQPITATLERGKIRNRRTEREHIPDEVSEALQDQMQSLQHRRAELKEQAASARRAIEELDRARKQLMEDIEDKDRSIGVDRSCAAMKNGAHSDYSYGFAKMGQGQTHMADTAASKKRQVTLSSSFS